MFLMCTINKKHLMVHISHQSVWISRSCLQSYLYCAGLIFNVWISRVFVTYNTLVCRQYDCLSFINWWLINRAKYLKYKARTGGQCGLINAWYKILRMQSNKVKKILSLKKTLFEVFVPKSESNVFEKVSVI